MMDLAMILRKTLFRLFLIKRGVSVAYPLSIAFCSSLSISRLMLLCHHQSGYYNLTQSIDFGLDLTLEGTNEIQRPSRLHQFRISYRPLSFGESYHIEAKQPSTHPILLDERSELLDRLRYDGHGYSTGNIHRGRDGISGEIRFERFKERNGRIRVEKYEQD
jgi:hypothetical protein